MSASTEFAMSLPFLGYKQRNAVLDNFYDTTRLTLEEKAKLSARRRSAPLPLPASLPTRSIPTSPAMGCRT
jgi:hypothetical protein